MLKVDINADFFFKPFFFVSTQCTGELGSDFSTPNSIDQDSWSVIKFEIGSRSSHQPPQTNVNCAFLVPFSHHTSSQFLQCTTFRPGCPSHFQVSLLENGLLFILILTYLLTYFSSKLTWLWKWLGQPGRNVVHCKNRQLVWWERGISNEYPARTHSVTVHLSRHRKTTSHKT